MAVGVFLGAFVWILFELNKGLKRQDFTYRRFFELNVVPFITNIFCGLVIVWAREDVTDYFVVTKFSSIMLGMAGQGIFKKIYTAFDNDSSKINREKNTEKDVD